MNVYWKTNPHYTYCIGSSTSKTTLQTTSLEKCVDVHIVHLFNFNQHVCEILKKINRINKQIVKKNICKKRKHWSLI